MTLVHGSNMLSVQYQQPQQIARSNVIVSASAKAGTSSSASAKRKMYAQQTPYSPAGQTPSVARRNARERNRVKQVNNGFATLRQHIPTALAQALGGNTAGTQGGARTSSKKLSKVETLRMAVEYIRNLQSLLDGNDSASDTSSTSSSSQMSPVSSMGSPIQSDMGSPQMMDHDQHMYHHQQPQQQYMQPELQQQIKFEIKAESDDEQFVHHQMQPMQYHQLHQDNTIYVPAASDASVSPTPSFLSDASSTGGSQGYGGFISTTYAPHPDSYDNYQSIGQSEESLIFDFPQNFYLPG